MAGKIFLNYRRGDDPGFTHALYQHLEREFTAGQLFMDVQGYIKPGDDFIEVLSSQVAGADIVLVVVGRRWSELMAQPDGGREDFVAIEIKAALDGGKRVIPVLVGGATMPRTDALPEGIRSLARRNAVDLRPERFKADCQELVTALKEQLANAEGARVKNAELELRAVEHARRVEEAEEAARIETARQLENRKWTAAGAREDSAALRTFLDEFPDGLHAQTARARLAALESRESQARFVATQAPQSAGVKSPVAGSGASGSGSRAAPAQDDVLELARTGAAPRDDLASSPAVTAIVPALVLGALAAIGGALAEGLGPENASLSFFGKPVFAGQAVVSGALVLGALVFLTDATKKQAVLASGASTIGWFLAEAFGVWYLQSDSGITLMALSLWGALDWSVPVLALSLTRPGRHPLSWLATVGVGGLASLVYFSTFSLSQTIRGAIFIGVPMVCIGYLLTPRRGESIGGRAVGSA